MATVFPVRTSHTLAVASSLAVTTSWPSGLKQAVWTLASCPCNVAIDFPVRTFQIRAVPSSLAVTADSPFELNSAVFTAPVCPRKTTRSEELNRQMAADSASCSTQCLSRFQTRIKLSCEMSITVSGRSSTSCGGIKNVRPDLRKSSMPA